MKITALLLAAALASPALAQTTAPAPAQTDPGPDRTGAVAGANAGVRADVAIDNAGRAMDNADVQAQYDADLAAYDRAVIAHHRAARRADATYMHQQRAYADAMKAWRFQTDECHRGVLKMCKLPTPDPADYF